MVKNYLISHFRNLLKNKIYFIINILGLTASLMCSMLAITLSIQVIRTGLANPIKSSRHD